MKDEGERAGARIAAEIDAERKRQIEAEGFSPDHDDSTNDSGELALAAACYATPTLLYRKDDYANAVRFSDPWPWDECWDTRPGEGNVIAPNDSLTPKKRRRQLIKAAALIVAEIERLDRLSPESAPSSPPQSR